MNKIIVFLGFLVVVWNKLSYCQQYFGFGFDQQSFLYWDFAKSLNLIPYKDFFYPYGLLFFLKSDNSIWYLISVLLSLTLTISVFLILKNTFKDKLYTYTFFISFCLYVNIFLSHDSYLRYAPLIFISFLMSFFIQKKKLFNESAGFLIGLTLGLLFSFINDLFFYSTILVSVVSFIYRVFNGKKVDTRVTRYILFALFGLLLGALPIIFYLLTHDALPGFAENYKLIKEISVFAKVPFPPSLKSFEHLMLTGVILLSIFSIIPGIYKKKSRDFSFYVKLSLLIGLLLLEQKNITRPFYQQLSFISFLVSSLLLKNIVDALTNLKIDRKVIYIFILNIIVLIFLLARLDRDNFTYEKSGGIMPTSSCFDQKIEKLDKKQLNKYIDVKNFIQKEYKGNIYSYPGDSVFYLLFNQVPPPYPSIYEATPSFAQSTLIEYIKENNIDYVIINTKSTSIQDGVPDQIRARLLYEYININYKEIKRIDNFLILLRSDNHLADIEGY